MSYTFSMWSTKNNFSKNKDLLCQLSSIWYQRLGHRTCFLAVIHVIWGHDESADSFNLQNFLQKNDESIKPTTLENSSGNKKLICSDIQKQVANVWAAEMLKIIMKDVIHVRLFFILVDQSWDLVRYHSIKDIMRYFIQVIYFSLIFCIKRQYLMIWDMFGSWKYDHKIRYL